jgi:hypothetical protein
MAAAGVVGLAAAGVVGLGIRSRNYSSLKVDSSGRSCYSNTCTL